MSPSRRARHALALSSLLLAACGGGSSSTAPQKFGYTLRLFDYPEIGRVLRLKLKDKDGRETLATFNGAIDLNGERTIVLENVLENGKEYRVDYFVDMDNDGYTPPLGAMFRDPSWRRLVTGRKEPVSDSHAHDNAFFDISPF